MPILINTEYDVGKAFAAIENELIASMIRNMDRHRAEEEKEGIQWTQWQAEQLKSLEKYKSQNRVRYGKQFKDINEQIRVLIQQARDTGDMDQEIEILQAIKNGFTGYQKMPSRLAGEFFKLNDRKLEALIKATTNDMQKAETAVLRMANDQYRKTIFSAQVYANSGAGTYKKAVDMATKDMLSSGLNCVQYANGARHTLSDYADMAIRTASKRAYLQGEGEKRQEWGISTVIINKRGNPCPKCLPFVGKILIDDVWSGGKSSDGKYPLMSTAIAAGLYHPRCKDSHTTYFPGISTADDTWTKEELEIIEKENTQNVNWKYAKRQADKYNRISKNSLDEENKKIYAQKSREWNKDATKKYLTHEELEKYLQKEYNASMDPDVKQLNIRQINQTFAEFERVMNDFPDIRKSFTGINAARYGKAAFSPNGELVLNPEYYQKLDTKLIGTGFHEAGHLIELSLIKNANPNANIDMVCELYKNGEYSERIVKKAYNNISSEKPLLELKGEISRYAKSNHSETLAEAIKDHYMNESGASILSRQIIKVIKEELK